jgi:ABC-type glycerol-3-phosphate transport system permease component
MIANYRAREGIRTGALFCVTWLVVLIAVFPLFWAVSTSLRGNQEIITRAPTLLPKEFTLSNYDYMLKVSNFPQQFSNSSIIAVLSALSVVFFGSLGGYSLTRFKFAGQGLSLRVVLLTYLFPAVLLVVPMFIILRGLQLTDNYASLVIVHTATGLPLGLWLLRAYFQSTSRTQMTLPLGIHTYMNDMGFEWGPLMALTVVFALPVVVLFTFLQSRLVRGLGAGAGAIKF